MARRYFRADAEAEVEERELTISRCLGIWNGPAYSDDRIPDGALASASNIVPGTWKSRGGMKTKHLTSVTGTGGIDGMHSYRPHSGSPELLFAINGTVYKNDASSLEASLTNNAFEFATYLNNVYYVNGDNGLRVYNGTTAVAVTAYTPGGGESANYLSDAANEIHNSKYIAVHEQVVYLAAPDALPYRVYRCDETQGATYFHNYVDVISKSGGKIVGMVPFRGNLVVLKNDSIWAMDGNIGDSTFALRQLHGSIGCAAGRTAVDVPALGLVFLGTDGHWYLLRPDYVSSTDVPLYRLSAHFADSVDNLNKAYLTTASGGWYNNYYYCSVPTGSSTTPDKTYVFDSTKVESLPQDPTALFVPWSIYTEPKASCFVEHSTGTVLYFLAGDYATGMVYRLDSTTADDSAAYTSQFETKNFSMNISHRIKVVSTLHFLANREASATTVTPYVSVEDLAYDLLDATSVGGFAGTWDVGTWDDGSTWDVSRTGYQMYTVPVNRTGRTMQFKFTQTAASRSMDISEMRIRFGYEGVR